MAGEGERGLYEVFEEGRVEEDSVESVVSKRLRRGDGP